MRMPLMLNLQIDQKYVMTLKIVNETLLKVGVAHCSIMYTRARAEAALGKLVDEENAGAEAFVSTQNSTVAFNHPELRDSSSHFDSLSQFRLLDPNICTTKRRKKMLIAAMISFSS